MEPVHLLLPRVDVAVDSTPPELLDALHRRLDLMPATVRVLLSAHLPLCRLLADIKSRHDGPLILGVGGAQGSGKTTFCTAARILLRELFGLSTCGFSIDDLYLTRREREQLGREIHPLFKIRGAPGTHDVNLGLELLDRLVAADEDERVPIPSFDKAVDDRLPRADWPVHVGRPDIVILEGWCVGVRPQSEEDLARPVNRLEEEEDPAGIWRSHVDDRLRRNYAELFGRLDRLIFLAMPDFENVRRWRGLQERKLATNRPDASAVMGSEELGRFLMTYERLTRWALDDLPHVADVVCELDEHHRIVRMASKEPWIL